MKRSLRSLAVSAAAAVTIAGAGVLAGGGAAFAAGGGSATPPPWQSTIAANVMGSITFYNAQGQVVTGGNLTANGLGAYAVASTTPTGGPYTRANLYLYTPVSGQSPLTWSNSLIGGSFYPVATAPVPLNTTTNPVEANTGTDATLSSLTAAFPNTQTAAGYPGLYDVRMVLTGAVGVTSSPNYYDTVISVNATAGTWSVYYPAYTQNTTTTLAATPASPQTAPAALTTLTATVTPAAAGTVSFWNGTTQVGATQTVTALNGVASVTTTPPSGTTTYTAIYSPTPGSADIGSSGTLSYVVNVPLHTSTTTLAQTGAGAAGTVTFTGVVTDTGVTPNVNPADGTVSLYDNGSTTSFAQGPVGVGGTFTIPFTYFSAGSHSVVATWSGDATRAGSSSAAVLFAETAPACTTCSTAGGLTGTIPAGTISISTPYTAANPLNLGPLALTPAGTYFTASKSLDTSNTVPGSTTFTGITIVDTKAGNLPWTASAIATDLTDGGLNPGSKIRGENVGLTNLAPVYVTGNAIVTPDVVVTNQAAPIPPVGPADLGSAGLGGTTPHVIATDSLMPVGTVGINGTITLNAPTSTEAGVFVGTLTFTIVG